MHLLRSRQAVVSQETERKAAALTLMMCDRADSWTECRLESTRSVSHMLIMET